MAATTLPFRSPVPHGSKFTPTICYRTFDVRAFFQQPCPCRHSWFRNKRAAGRGNVAFFCLLLRMLDALLGVKTYLCERIDWEPSPYYKGRYLVALILVLHHRHSRNPYLTAELQFRDSRVARKIDRWLAERRERFPYLEILADGTVGKWLDAQSLASPVGLREAGQRLPLIGTVPPLSVARGAQSPGETNGADLPPKKPVRAERLGPNSIQKRRRA